MRPLAPSEWEEVVRRVRGGETIAALAREFGVHPSSISRRLPKAKKPAAPRPGAPKRSAGAAPATACKGRAGAEARTPRAAPRARSPLVVRRQLIGRLYRAIDTKLKLMERRMNSEITALDAGNGDDGASNLTAADHERETRAFGALVKTINSVRQMQAELDQLAIANPNTTAADARLAADADRYRRDIAERLAKFVPPQS